MIYKTVFTDRRLIDVRQSNSIWRQLTSAEKASLGSKFAAPDSEDWRESLTELTSRMHTDDA